MEYREMTVADIPMVTALYVASFNAAPWYDKWTEESAAKRLIQMLRRDSAYGLLAYDAQGVCGLIIGDEEQFYYGPRFRFVNFVWITAAEARDWALPFIRNWSSGCAGGEFAKLCCILCIIKPLKDFISARA